MGEYPVKVCQGKRKEKSREKMGEKKKKEKEKAGAAQPGQIPQSKAI